MTTPELIEYIQKEREQNTPEETIREKLANAGWDTEDIDNGFLESSKKTIVASSKQPLPNKDLKDFETLFTPLKIIEHDLSEHTSNTLRTKTKNHTWWIVLFILFLVLIIFSFLFLLYPEYLDSLRAWVNFV